MTTRRLRETLLWIGAVLGTVCLVWTVAVAALGLTPLVFLSGSMSPAIHAGDLSFGRTVPAADLREDDVVSVENAAGVRVTHRVVGIERTADGATLTLQGDANDRPDDETYPVTSAVRVVSTVPKAGYVVHAIGSPVGIFLGGLLVGGALLAAFTGRREARPAAPRGGARRAPRRGGGTAAVVAVLAVGAAASALGTGVAPTLAAFQDTATMTSAGTSAADAPAAPASMTCVNSGSSATLTWPNGESRPGSSAAYVLETASTPTGAASGTPRVLAPASGDTRSSTFSSGLLGGLFSGSTLYVRVYTAFVDGNGDVTWQSPTYRLARLSVSAILGTVRCVGQPT